MLAEFQYRYFFNLQGLSDYDTFKELLFKGLMNEKQVRNTLIREQFYKDSSIMPCMDAYAKCANDFRLSVVQVQRIVGTRA